MGKFRIKIVPWWASDKWVNLKYSTNGIFWHTIQESYYDALENQYYMNPITSHYSNSDTLIKRFQTIEEVKEYETKQRKIVNMENDSIRKREMEEEKKKREVYKRFG